MQAGEVFYDAWGYDQTNYDFVKVEKVSPTGKSVLCRMMGQKVLSQEIMAEWIVPSQPFGELFRLRVRGYNGEDRLVGSYPFCNGSKRSGYFFKWEGKPVLQTHYH